MINKADFSKLPDIEKISPIKILGEGETPIPGTSVPYLDITPEDRRLANESKGAFNKAILTRVYEINKKIGMNEMNNRLSYGLNFSGDHVYIPIGEYCDDSDLFTFYIQASSLNSTYIENDLGVKGAVASAVKYEEIVMIHSLYFRNIDENGEPIEYNTNKAVDLKIDEMHYKENIIEPAERVSIGRWNWATDPSLDINLFLNGMIEGFEILKRKNIGNNIHCINLRNYLVKQWMMIINYRYKIAKDQLTDEQWNILFEKYGKLMKDLEVEIFKK